MLLGEARKRGAPVADPAVGPAVEVACGLRAVDGQSRDVELRDRVEAPSGVFEPRRPERTGVSQDAVEVERYRAHRRALCKTRMPIATPAASIATSTGEAWRPLTKCWCASSLIAYAIPAAS